MKTLETITEIFKVLDKQGVEIDDAPGVLDLTRAFIELTQQMQKTEPEVTPAKVLSAVEAAARRRKIKM